jgi:hypothetical protein
MTATRNFNPHGAPARRMRIALIARVVKSLKWRFVTLRYASGQEGQT